MFLCADTVIAGVGDFRVEPELDAEWFDFTCPPGTYATSIAGFSYNPGTDHEWSMTGIGPIGCSDNSQTGYVNDEENWGSPTQVPSSTTGYDKVRVSLNAYYGVPVIMLEAGGGRIGYFSLTYTASRELACPTGMLIAGFYGSFGSIIYTEGYDVKFVRGLGVRCRAGESWSGQVPEK